MLPSLLLFLVLAGLVCTIVSATGRCPLWVPVFLSLFVQAVQLYGGVR